MIFSSIPISPHHFSRNLFETLHNTTPRHSANSHHSPFLLEVSARHYGFFSTLAFSWSLSSVELLQEIIEHPTNQYRMSTDEWSFSQDEAPCGEIRYNIFQCAPQKPREDLFLCSTKLYRHNIVHNQLAGFL